jgi:chromatin assembly factor 1 subunit B
VKNRSPDGQCLVLSSRDGYCTLITFDEIIPAHHTQQQSLQLQSLANAHAVPIAYSTSAGAPPHQHTGTLTPLATPLSGTIGLPTPTPPAGSKKRSEPPVTPTETPSGGRTAELEEVAGGKEAGEERDKMQEPPKKKRRVALTKIGDLGS